MEEASLVTLTGTKSVVALQSHLSMFDYLQSDTHVSPFVHQSPVIHISHCRSEELNSRFRI